MLLIDKSYRLTFTFTLLESAAGGERSLWLDSRVQASRDKVRAYPSNHVIKESHGDSATVHWLTGQRAKVYRGDLRFLSTGSRADL